MRAAFRRATTTRACTHRPCTGARRCGAAAFAALTLAAALGAGAASAHPGVRAHIASHSVSKTVDAGGTYDVVGGSALAASTSERFAST